MPLLALPVNYLLWHYTLAWRDLARIYRDFLWFTYNFFSLPVLVRTWVAPWKRLGEAYPAHLDIGGTLATFLVNTLMRIVGFVFRTIMIVVGLIALALVFILGLLAFFVWLLLPPLLVLVFYFGLKVFLTKYV